MYSIVRDKDYEVKKIIREGDSDQGLKLKMGQRVFLEIEVTDTYAIKGLMTMLYYPQGIVGFENLGFKLCAISLKALNSPFIEKLENLIELEKVEGRYE